MALPELAHINVVVQKELLPTLVRDSPVLTTHFTGFRFSGFAVFNGTVRGNLQARRRADLMLFQVPIAITDSLTEMNSPTELFNIIDRHFEEALRQLEQFTPHTPGALCNDIFCAECYE